MNSGRKVITDAGLKTETQAQFLAALQRLSAEGVSIASACWDGTRCDLLVADVDDRYGHHASRLMVQRGGTLLALSSAQTDVSGAHATLSPHASEDALLVALRKLLGDVRSVQKPQAHSAPITGAGLLGNMLQNGNADADSLIARRGPLEILIHRSASRILAPSQKELLVTRAMILSDEWSVSPREPNAGIGAQFQTSVSLDVFLLDACISMEARLPSMPPRVYRLTQWPDMGKLGDYVDALRIVAALVREPLSAAMLEARTGVGAQRINAVLWATQTAGLLEMHAGTGGLAEPLPVAGERSRFASVLGKLMRRFGLDWATTKE